MAQQRLDGPLGDADSLGAPMLPGLDQAGGRVARPGEPHIIDDARPRRVPMIGDHEVRHADRHRQRPAALAGSARAAAGRWATAWNAGRAACRRVSITGRSARARSSSLLLRGPSSTAGSHTRFMSSSRKRDAVGCSGSNRAKAEMLANTRLSRPRAGWNPLRSKRSSTIAPAISLPCERATRTTCGPGNSPRNVVTPGKPVLPGNQDSISGAASSTGKCGTAPVRVAAGPIAAFTLQACPVTATNGAGALQRLPFIKTA